jgi:hypothetical protein
MAKHGLCVNLGGDAVCWMQMNFGNQLEFARESIITWVQRSGFRVEKPSLNHIKGVLSSSLLQSHLSQKVMLAHLKMTTFAEFRKKILKTFYSRLTSG